MAQFSRGGGLRRIRAASRTGASDDGIAFVGDIYVRLWLPRDSGEFADESWQSNVVLTMFPQKGFTSGR